MRVKFHSIIHSKIVRMSWVGETSQACEIHGDVIFPYLLVYPTMPVSTNVPVSQMDSPVCTNEGWNNGVWFRELLWVRDDAEITLKCGKCSVAHFWPFECQTSSHISTFKLLLSGQWPQVLADLYKTRVRSWNLDVISHLTTAVTRGCVS